MYACTGFYACPQRLFLFCLLRSPTSVSAPPFVSSSPSTPLPCACAFFVPWVAPPFRLPPRKGCARPRPRHQPARSVNSTIATAARPPCRCCLSASLARPPPPATELPQRHQSASSKHKPANTRPTVRYVKALILSFVPGRSTRRWARFLMYSRQAARVAPQRHVGVRAAVHFHSMGASLTAPPALRCACIARKRVSTLRCAWEAPERFVIDRRSVPRAALRAWRSRADRRLQCRPFLASATAVRARPTSTAVLASSMEKALGYRTVHVLSGIYESAGALEHPARTQHNLRASRH